MQPEVQIDNKLCTDMAQLAGRYYCNKAKTKTLKICNNTDTDVVVVISSNTSIRQHTFSHDDFIDKLQKFERVTMKEYSYVYRKNLRKFLIDV